MSYLYITEDGAVLNVDGGYFIVTYKDNLTYKIPKNTLESVALFGNVSLTTPCVKQCLEMGIAVNYFSKRGAYFGRLESTRHKNIKRLKRQLILSENPQFSLALSKRIIDAKLNNQSVVLRRYIRHGTYDAQEELHMMKIARSKIENAQDAETLMGYEGMAAKSYFAALGKLVSPDFAFSGRTKMPPTDPFNSMLSLGYTLLMYEIYGELENKGLSPYAGFLHKDRERHPTLASDLMEEWRAVIVDSVVMSLVQGNEVAKENFIADESSGGVFLDKTAMKTFLDKMEKKLRSETGYIESTYRMSFRKALWHQADCLTAAIEEGDAQRYSPILIR